MCSTSVQRIAEIGQAIDELAARAGAAGARNGPTSEGLRASEARESEARAPQGPASEAMASDSGQVVIRLAELWAQLAELDPEVARRLPIYEA
jgi:hypothetical protein